MKKFMLVLSLSLAIGAVITLNSCKKTATSTSDDSISAQDYASLSNAVNATSDDATAAAGQVKSFSGKTEGWWNSAVLCGATTVDTGTVGNRVITITYDGTTTCNGITRQGSVSIVNSSGIAWKDAGSVLTITFNSLVITDPISGYSYTITGSHTLTKETAGLEWQVIAQVVTNTTVTRRNTGTLTITFSDGTSRTWTVDRTRSWSSAIGGGVNTITVSIYSEAAGGVDVTGTNRFGTPFTNTIETAIAANNQTGCIWRPYQGKMVHSIANRTTTVLFGTNSAGTSIGSPTTCGDGYFITTVRNNRTFTRFVRYW